MKIWPFCYSNILNWVWGNVYSIWGKHIQFSGNEGELYSIFGKSHSIIWGKHSIIMEKYSITWGKYSISLLNKWILTECHLLDFILLLKMEEFIVDAAIHKLFQALLHIVASWSDLIIIVQQEMIKFHQLYNCTMFIFNLIRL